MSEEGYTFEGAIADAVEASKHRKTSFGSVYIEPVPSPPPEPAEPPGPPEGYPTPEDYQELIEKLRDLKASVRGGVQTIARAKAVVDQDHVELKTQLALLKRITNREEDRQLEMQQKLDEYLDQAQQAFNIVKNRSDLERQIRSQVIEAGRAVRDESAELREQLVTAATRISQMEQLVLQMQEQLSQARDTLRLYNQAEDTQNV